MATVLVVDDDPQVRFLVTAIAQREGHQVIQAANGIEALSLFRSGAVDLVITDVLMPEMDGPGLVVRIRNQSPAVPCIFMSGYFSEHIRQQIGSYPLLMKPFTIPELRAAIRGAVRMSELG